jgi:hypothetical protein
MQYAIMSNAVVVAKTARPVWHDITIETSGWFAKTSNRTMLHKYYANYILKNFYRLFEFSLLNSLHSFLFVPLVV